MCELDSVYIHLRILEAAFFYIFHFAALYSMLKYNSADDASWGFGSMFFI